MYEPKDLASIPQRSASNIEGNGSSKGEDSKFATTSSHVHDLFNCVGIREDRCLHKPMILLLQ